METAVRSLLDTSLGLRYNELRVMKDDANNSLPPAPAALHILLSLAAEDLHGYEMNAFIRSLP
jgi:hypothetical protein